MAQKATCQNSRCGREYKVGHSTAAKYLIYCCGQCQIEAGSGIGSMADPTMPRVTNVPGGTKTSPSGTAVADWYLGGDKPKGGSSSGLPLTGGTGFSLTEGGSPTHPSKGCTHDAKTPVLTIGTRQIYGARATYLMTAGLDLSHLDLIIDASGQVKAPRKFIKAGGGRRFAGLNADIWPDLITLDWPDMTAPTNVKASFWVRMLDLLPEHTCISCLGSHGRTGTAMAALLVASGMEADPAIAKVRKSHCHHAIETEKQAQYIRTLAKQMEAIKAKGGL